MTSIKNSKQRCKKFRKRILDLSQKVSALHIGGSFSSTEIMDLIYFTLMKKNERDSFILSKGHASILHYVILEHLKILKKKDLENYCKPQGFLGVHPDIGNPGINASTGSLGHGLSMAAGIAIANMNSKKKTYVIISDGELQEGSTWEAIISIGALKLKNLILFVDNNDLNSSEKMSDTHPNLYPIDKKLKSFGWDAGICNGHDYSKMLNIIAKRDKRKPFALIAKTKKGYPIKFMNDAIWHYRSPTKKEYNQAIDEIERY